MKTISRWANRHIRLTILIIICCEVFNAFSGLLLGMNLLEGWPIGGLLLLAVVKRLCRCARWINPNADEPCADSGFRGWLSLG